MIAGPSAADPCPRRVAMRRSGRRAVRRAAVGAAPLRRRRRRSADVRAVATTTQVGDLRAPVAGGRADVRQILHAERRPARVRAAPERRASRRRRGRRRCAPAATSTRGSATCCATPGSTRRRDAHRRAAVAAPRRGRHRSALVAGPAQRRSSPSARSATRWSTPTPPVARRTTPTPRAYRRAAARAGPRDRAPACARSRAARRKLVTDHDALGYYADRYGIDVVGTVIPRYSTQAQASAGEVARLVRTIRAAGVRDDLPGELGQPEAHARDRARGRRARRPRAVRRHARRAGLGGRDLPRLAARQHARARRRLHQRRRRALPYARQL